MSGPARQKQEPTLTDRLDRLRKRAWHTGRTRRARKVQHGAEAMDRRHKAMGIDD